MTACCSVCDHGSDHEARDARRADGPVACPGCLDCALVLEGLGLPRVFRLAHLVLLHGVAREAQDTDDGAVDLLAAELAFVVRLDQLSVGDEGEAAWRDAGWLAHDLEDWGLLTLSHGSTRGHGGAPGPTAVSLTTCGAAVLRVLPH